MDTDVDNRLSKKSRVMLIICILVLITGLTVSLVAAYNTSAPEIYVTLQRGSNYKIVYDRETKVIYNMTDGKYNKGELFPLYNSDGSLKTYTGE